MSFLQPVTGKRRGADIDKLVAYLEECNMPLSKPTIYNYCSEGIIPYRRLGGRRKGKIYFDLDKIDAWIDQDNEEWEQPDTVAELEQLKALNNM
ncbi:helix-turn-helix transcriptional regulator [Carnobacterium maltaromaticum]|uniref:helix-turn-helix transcriptional regulator n=1 Tax=Carnobacterium maltaromaticum TaxID=2751 RepID=UPI0039AEC9A2